jgi:hypothetical protein
MAKYSAKELAEELGIRASTVNVAHHRGLIVRYHYKIDRQFVYDTMNETNALWISKVKASKDLEKPRDLPKKRRKKKVEKPEVNEEVKEKETPPIEEVPGQKEVLESVKRQNELAEKKKQAELTKVENQIKLQEIEINKAKGNLVDAEIVLKVVKLWATTVKEELRNRYERRNDQFCAAHMIEKVSAARHKNAVIQDVNDSVKAAIEVVSKQFKTI